MELDLLPLCFERELKDLVYLYKSLFGYLDVNNYVTFVNHGRTRLSRTSPYMLQSQPCKTTTFQSSFYNRTIKTWNCLCKNMNFNLISNPNCFKNVLRRKHLALTNTYDIESPCSWSLVRNCSCHRLQIYRNVIVCNNAIIISFYNFWQVSCMVLSSSVIPCHLSHLILFFLVFSISIRQYYIFVIMYDPNKIDNTRTRR